MFNFLSVEGYRWFSVSGVKPQGVGPKICTYVTNPYEAMKFDFDGPPKATLVNP